MGLTYRFTLVDALRGVAALSVVLFHAVEGNHIPALFGAMPAWLQTVLEHGNCGVAIFYVLSGFVIAHSLRPEGLTAVDVGRFMLRRSLRLDPPYWGAITIAISFSILASAMLKDRTADHFTIGQIAAHIFYLQELLKIREINPVFWTLCMEVQFYIVFAAMLLTKSRVMLFIAFAISLIWPLGLSVAPTGLFVSLWYGFLVGAGSYLSWKNGNARPWFYLYSAILTSAMIYRSDVFGLTCCGTALLLHSASRLGYIGTSLNWRWIQFLGMISYSLYLIHGPITGAAFRVGFTLTGHSIVLEAIWWAVSLAASIAAAAIFYFIMERPSIKLSKMITIHQQKNKGSIPAQVV
jgi:peptidoglycan/LPS O-acetylase OafA/YrhL